MNSPPAGAGFSVGRTRLAFVYVSVLFFMAGEGALHILVPPYLAIEHDLGPAAIGLVVGVFGVASLVTRLPVGAVYTAARGRALLVAGGGVSAGSFALVPLADGPVQFAALMALDGLGWSVATTVQLVMLVAARRGEGSTASAMGWYSGFTGLGHTIAGVGGGALADFAGFETAFYSLAAATAVGAVLVIQAIPPAERAPAPAGRPPRRTRLRRRAAETWSSLGGMPVIVWTGVLAMFYINVINGAVSTFHPVLALGAGLTLTQIGFLASCRSWSSSFVRLGSGVVFARVGIGRHLTGLLLLVGAASVFFIPTVRSSFLLQIPLFLATGLSRGLLRVTGSAQAFDGVGDRERAFGLTAAVLHSGLDLGRVAGPVLAGLIAHAVGIATMFRVLPLVLLAIYGVLALTARRGARAELSSAESP